MGLDFFEAFFVHRFPQRGALLRAGMGRMMAYQWNASGLKA
jgi:hypothetical protein